MTQSHLHIMFPYRLLSHHEGDKMIQHKKETEEIALAKFDMIKHQVLDQANISFDFKPEVGFLSDHVKDRVRKTALTLS